LDGNIAQHIDCASQSGITNNAQVGWISVAIHTIEANDVAGCDVASGAH
jgi:hypothetical protein